MEVVRAVAHLWRTRIVQASIVVCTSAAGAGWFTKWHSCVLFVTAPVLRCTGMLAHALSLSILSLVAQSHLQGSWSYREHVVVAGAPGDGGDVLLAAGALECPQRQEAALAWPVVRVWAARVRLRSWQSECRCTNSLVPCTRLPQTPFKTSSCPTRVSPQPPSHTPPPTAIRHHLPCQTPHPSPSKPAALQPT